MKPRNAIALIVGMPCGMLLFFILMACLWDYRVWVGASLLLLIFLVVGVYVRGQITEQNIRVYRFNHHEETPLHLSGQPQILRPDMRESSFNCYQVPAPYQEQLKQ